MRLIIFVVTLLVIITLVVEIASLHFTELSSYGMGYLSGKAIIIALLTVLEFFLARSIFGNQAARD